jgi:hypothetical protein
MMLAEDLMSDSTIDCATSMAAHLKIFGAMYEAADVCKEPRER